MSIFMQSGAQSCAGRFVSCFINGNQKKAVAFVMMLSVLLLAGPAIAQAATTLTVGFTGTQSATVSSSPTGINSCAWNGSTTSGTCSGSFSNYTTITLTLTPGVSAGVGTWTVPSGLSASNINCPAGSLTCSFRTSLSGTHSGTVVANLVQDITSPALAEVTPVPNPTNDTTPNYTFSSTEAGTITYGGDCSSSDTSASSGNNTETFNTLATGVHSNCTITVTDAAGNASSPLAVNSFTIDTTPPTVTINQGSAQSDPTSSSPVVFDVVFSKSVTGFTASDVTVTGTATHGTATVSGSGTTYTVSIPVTKSGTIIATVNASAAQDAAGNNTAASTSTDNSVTYTDTTAPVLAEVTPVTNPTTDTTPNYTFSSTEAGTITYGGDCSSSDTSASSGNNTETFNTLSLGTHSNCTIMVTDSSGNPSAILNVTPFTIAVPDLTVTKTNNLGGAHGLNGAIFNWIITITNSGTATSTFTSGSTVLTDNLPTSGATYASPVVVKGSGVTGTITCSISSNTLSCTSGTSTNVLAIPAGSAVTITVPTTPTAAGSLVNPRSGGTCKVDPTGTNGVVSESNESNNNCAANTVTVEAIDASNLIQNPSFESGSDNAPSSWENGSYNVTSTLTTVNPGRTGARAAQVVITATAGGDAKWITANTIPVTAGQYYTFSDWYKSDVPTEIDLFFTTGGVENSGDLFISLPAATSWTQAQSNFFIPNGVTGVRIAHVIGSVGTLTTDDYSLKLATASVFSQGMVSLNFDDGWQSFYDSAFPVLTNYGLKSTEYIITGPNGSNIGGTPTSGYMTTAEIKQLQSAGHDIAAHSRSHPDLTTLNSTDLQSEVAGSRTDLTSNGFTPVDNFAYPNGTVNATVESAVQTAGFSGGRGIDNGLNDKSTDKFNLKAYEIFSTTPVSDVENLIDTAVSTKTWVIFFTHKVLTDCGTDTECITPTTLDTIAKYLHDHQVETVTVHQGLAVMNGGAMPDQIPPTITGLSNDPATTSSKVWTWGANETATFRFVVDQNPTWTPSGTYGSTTTATQNTGNGAYYLHVQAKDTSGNESAVTTVSAVIDTTVPVITIAPYTMTPTNQDITVNASANEGTLNATSHTFTANGSFDFVATDSAHNTATSTVTITNIDKIAPVIASHDPVTAEATSPAGAAVTYTSPITTDNVDPASVATCSPVSGSTFVLGSTEVTCNTIDSAGNAASPTTFAVTVVDTTKPVITLTGENPQTIQAGSAYTELGATVSDNYDSGLSATIDASAVITSALGSYPVTYNVTDTHGNIADTVTRTVTVIDTTKPVITLSGTNPVSVEVHSAYTDAGATASDNLDGNITAKIVPASGVNMDVVGTYTVTYNVTDSQLNAADPLTRTVNVVDTTKPIITLTGDASVTIEVHTDYTDAGATASDNYDGDLTAKIVTVNPVNKDLIGDYMITYNVTDANGNVADQVTRTVHVVDTTIPVVTLVGNNPQTVEDGTSYPELGATVSDNYDNGLSATIDASAVNTGALGNYTVIYNAVDLSGNHAVQVTRTVQVVDTIKPVVSVTTPTGTTNATPAIDFTATDATALTLTCAVDSNTPVSCTTDHSFTTPILSTGTHTVTVTATDNGGNTTSATTGSFTADATIPTVSITNKPASFINTNSVSLDFTVDDPTATLVCTLDGSPFTPCTSPASLSGLSESLHTFSVSATDEVGNTGVDSTGFTVDLTAPHITVNNLKTNNVTPTVTGTSDDTASVSVTLTIGSTTYGPYTTAPSSGNWSANVTDTLADGTYSISVSSTDQAGNTGTATGSLVVNTKAPTLIVNPLTPNSKTVSGTATNDGSTSITVTVTVGSNVYPDMAPDSSGNWYVDVSSYPETKYPVKVNAHDELGNQSEITGELIIDTNSPVINIVQPTIVAEATSSAGAYVSYTLPSATDNVDASVTVICDPLSDTLFPIGKSSVTCTATDTAGNAATPASFIVEVKDTTGPIIASHDDITVNATSPSGATVTYDSPIATDAVDGNVTSTCNPASGSVFPIDKATTVTCDASDSHGNNAAQTTFTVTVVDPSAPVITLKGDSTMNVILDSGIFTDPGATASDEIYGDISVDIKVSGDTVDTTKAGTYHINYDVTNASGKTALTITRMVIVSSLVLGTEQTPDVSTNSITITWTTTHPATSRVLYDTVSHDPITDSAPNYGYANSTTEDSTLVTSHSVVVSGLSAGTKYYFRPVSHGSPETLGDEIAVTTTTPPPAPVVASNGPIGGGGGGGGVVYTPSVKINNGATQTNSKNVTLTLNASYPTANQMWISNDSSFTSGGWVTYATSASWTLSDGAGTKTVYVRFGVGNSLLGTAQSSIELTTGAGVGQVLGASTFNFIRTLSLGSRGEDVTELQKRLTAEGFYSGPITGYFGPLTQAAVKAYQTKNGLEPVGVVGPKTRLALNGGEPVVAGASTVSVDALAQQIQALLAQVAKLQAELKAAQGQ